MRRFISVQVYYRLSAGQAEHTLPGARVPKLHAVRGLLRCGKVLRVARNKAAPGELPLGGAAPLHLMNRLERQQIEAPLQMAQNVPSVLAGTIGPQSQQNVLVHVIA